MNGQYYPEFEFILSLTKGRESILIIEKTDCL